VPELTISPATESITFGATRNPWDVTRTPGGSSGGTASAVAAGLAPIGLGSDGGGSIRGPSCWCGLFGVKPQRDRVPMAPHDGAWQGMSVNGPIARSVADAALVLDATADGVPKGGFAAAAEREPGRLRVAVSTKGLPGIVMPLGAEERSAVERTATLLEDLGHEVIERDPDWSLDLGMTAFARVLRGIAEDVESSMPHPERLEPRTRQLAKVGRRIPNGQIRRAREREAEQARRIGVLFEEADVLLLPACAQGPYLAGELGRWSTSKWLAMVAMRYGYFPPFNATGQPACNVPAGYDDDGLPIGVQLVGRPRDEVTLISLAAQIETARPWAQRRPPES
jgi:amidase